MTDDKEIFSFDEIIDDFKDLHAATDEMGILINNFMWGAINALNVQPINRPRKPKRIRQPLRYPRRCRPRPRGTPGVNPLNRLKTVNGKGEQ